MVACPEPALMISARSDEVQKDTLPRKWVRRTEYCWLTVGPNGVARLQAVL